MERFEVGNTYGNWCSPLARTVIARSRCYVTFEGGLRKRVAVVRVGREQCEAVVCPGMCDFNVYAAACLKTGRAECINEVSQSLVNSLANHVHDTPDTITKGEKTLCLVKYADRGRARSEFVPRVIYAHAESDVIESRYIRWRGMWVELDNDFIARL